MSRKSLRTWIGEEPFNTVLCHEKESIPLIQRVVYDWNPELMIEFGTCAGGVTLLLHQYLPDIPLHTFDNASIVSSLKKSGRMNKGHILRFQKEVFNDNVYFHVTNIFHEGKEQVLELVRSDKRKVVYCDNGKKHDEISLFGSQLNKGDLVGVHDWGYEVGWEYPGVSETLSNFEEHYMNEVFKNNNLSTRFFKRM